MSDRQPADTLIFQFLTDDGTASGEYNANGDYASTSTNFYIRCPSTASSGVSYYIYRMIVEIEDTKGMEPEEYGNLGSALANGYSVQVMDASLAVLQDIEGGHPIVDNTSWALLGYDVDIEGWTNTTNEVVFAKLDFVQATGSPLWLRPGERLNVDLTDNMTGLIQHHFKVQGKQSY
jgi:hypothetical protein